MQSLVPKLFPKFDPDHFSFHNAMLQYTCHNDDKQTMERKRGIDNDNI